MVSLLDNLPHTCTAYPLVNAQGTLGGSKSSRGTALFTDRACWRQAASDAERMRFQKREIVVTDKVYFASDPGLDETHELVIGDDTLSVRSSAKPDASAGLGVLWRIMVELE